MGTLLRQNWLAALGGLVALLIVVVALGAPLIAPRDPLKADFRHMNKPPSAVAYFGTDQVGRDEAVGLVGGPVVALGVGGILDLVGAGRSARPAGGPGPGGSGP